MSFKTRRQIINESIDKYFANQQIQKPYDGEKIINNIIDFTNKEIGLENAKGTHERYKILSNITPLELVGIVPKLHIVKNISLIDSTTNQYTCLGIYSEEEGIYITSYDEVSSIIYNIFPRSLTSKDVKETIEQLKMFKEVPKTTITKDKNLVPVNNGIYNRKSKKLLSFSPEYVFLSKSTTNYNPDAKLKNIHNPVDNTDWNVDDWIDDLVDDEELSKFLWEIISASIRSNQIWDKGIWFYSEIGNNGKGTFTSLIRNLMGYSNCISIPVADFGNDFKLEPLINTAIVLTDENNVNQYIDKSANYKATITGDPIFIDIKYKTPITFTFTGLNIQCMNGFPKTKDKSGSFYRRLAMIPFNKSFEGKEKKYIKKKYLKDKDVLEYVLKKALEMDFETFSEPDVIKTTLNEYKEFNNTFIQFWSEIEPQLKWDKIPINFLYDLYIGWCKRYSPDGKSISKITFKNELAFHLKHNKIWELRLKKGNYIRKGTTIYDKEPLIWEYKLENWYNPSYKGTDVDKICSYSQVPSSFNGIFKK